MTCCRNRLIAASLLFACVSFASLQADENTVDFGRKIRPLLAEKCFSCHGLDEDNRATEMRLDTQEGLLAALDSDGFAVVPGKPDKSVLYQRIVAEDEYERMPPEEYEKPLTPEEIKLVRLWIEQGAVWKQHWSLVAP